MKPLSDAEEKKDQDTRAPAVSVVIPAYKVAPFIAETLDSVFAQTFCDFEVIVVNDGSPDTEELERSLAPYRDRIIYVQQENRGAGAARNRGVLEAHGEFVAFLDGDDIWLPTYLEEQLRFVRERGLDFAYTDAHIFGDTPLDGSTYMENSPSDGPITFRSLIRNECNPITSGVVARRRAVIDAGMFDEGLRNAQDFELWVRLVRRGARADYQRRPLLRYRWREGSLSGDVLNRLGREWRVTKWIADTYDLDEDERAEVKRMLGRQQAALELVRGKQLLREGRFREAEEALAHASRVLGTWKLRAAALLARFAPKLLLKIAGGRLETRP